MTNQLSTVENVVVLMLENRSFDNLMGYLYAENVNVSPNGDPYDGLTGNESNPTSVSGTTLIQVKPETSDGTIPKPDPGEEYQHVNTQLFQPPGEQNKGFVIDYETQDPTNYAQIMRCFDPSMAPCLRQIANQYAVCDAWHASVPSQTWPNRSFVHCASSNGNINNWPYDPFQWDINTIFNVMAHTQKASWFVYYDELYIPLTRLQFPHLWPHGYKKNFKPFAEFLNDANAGSLPNYSFIEPNFFHNPINGRVQNDQHPPADMTPGDTFIGQVFNAIVTSPQWKANQVLFVITHDEHGGCYDHVFPPQNATPPKGSPGKDGFNFKRFGVRVPLVVVSPYVPAGSVFNAPSSGPPFDHTSILATLERRFGISPLDTRDAVAPDLGIALTLAHPRTDSAPISLPQSFVAMDVDEAENTPLNELQMSIVHGVYNAMQNAPLTAPRLGVAPDAAATFDRPETVTTVGEAFRYIRRAPRKLRM